MANPLGGKTLKAAITNGFPIGAVIECAVTPADGTWLPVSGQSLNRCDYPLLAERYPLGSTTFTLRTTAATPVIPTITASPTYFVQSAATGTAAIQYSADGVTWSTASTVMSSGTVCCVIWAGSRFVAVYSATVSPNVTTGDNPNSTWTTTTGAAGLAGSGSINYSQLAYSPQLGMTAFVTPLALGTSIYTLLDGSTTWVTQTASSSTYRCGICWTGLKFITINTSSMISSSVNGVTWSDRYLPKISLLSNATIASNGAGVVVVYTYNLNYLGYELVLVSNDHGSTWKSIKIPTSYTEPTGVVFSGGKFFLIYGNPAWPAHLIWSNDGENWTIDPSFSTLAMSDFGAQCIAMKGSTIAGWNGAADGFTGTINNSKFTLPPLMTAPYSSTYGAIMPCQYYIKAR